MSSRHRAALAALSALAVAGIAPGLAQAANPKPCNGAPLIEDATDDSLVKPLGGMPLSPSTGKHAGAPNEELENVWMSWEKGDDGKKVLTANIQLAKVDQT